MPLDNTSLIMLGVGAAILLWLVFSLMKKLFGLALVAALAFGAYVVWTNPDLLRNAIKMAGLS
jgi:hypothetical protein